MNPDGKLFEGDDESSFGGGWNYRIIRFEKHYALHEVFYDTDGNPSAHTKDPINFSCEHDEGTDGITQSLAMALSDATNKPVLPIDDFPYRQKEKK